ncbi:OLC1v1038101C1 [Oldenlandia corymbosa var. corymbosa]|uniref:OLC1v1038101C1 n=1 Tax=Oldenlandia corymbosa var. corymbosa TaxID=529605 RepID=A0AAV1D0H8_OLDCO|nr:OLC1v1038101C1 [Oldenlandia corymbosa var. corymbosa]
MTKRNNKAHKKNTSNKGGLTYKDSPIEGSTSGGLGLQPDPNRHHDLSKFNKLILRNRGLSSEYNLGSDMGENDIVGKGKGRSSRGSGKGKLRDSDYSIMIKGGKQRGRLSPVLKVAPLMSNCSAMGVSREHSQPKPPDPKPIALLAVQADLSEGVVSELHPAKPPDLSGEVHAELPPDTVLQEVCAKAPQ